jgi:anti-anti-sigma factor
MDVTDGSTADNAATEFAVIQLVEGQLFESHALEETYRELLGLVEGQARNRLVLDFSSVRSISATGLGRLLALKKKVKTQGGDLVLRNVGCQVYEVFAATKLAGYFGLQQEPDIGCRARAS